MTTRIILLLLVPLSLFIIYRVRSALSPKLRISLSVLVVLLGSWYAYDWYDRPNPAPERSQATESHAALETLTSQACSECHKSRHASWHRSFHRTMTREATPEDVKADFNDVVYTYQGVTSRMYRRGDRFFIETIDPEWGEENLRMERQGIPLERRSPERRKEFSVDRLVGSHWFQQMLHRDPQGRYIRLPFAYHLVEKRWLHIDGAFLGPETPSFFGRSAIWNDICLFCHNTRPMKNPNPPFAEKHGFDTVVSELGISCEACHGPGENHIRAHKDASRNAREFDTSSADPTIINPARLSVKRSDDICAHCHGAGMLPLPEVWSPETDPDPFQPGNELAKSHYVYWSESDLQRRKRGPDAAFSRPRYPGPLDGRFWGDGTPLTTAHEYQGMALSKCYQNGEGKMGCLSCHAMHGSDPNHQLKQGMRTNEACYGCHDTYRDKLAEHTHHPADSPGSLCYNCHMPFQVYSLLDTHRTHRIAVPHVRDSIDTGKPHACNLCHLDKSLGWTEDQLQKWYGTKPEPLSNNDRMFASSLLHLMTGDARTRAVVAGAFSWSPAQQASGKDWPGLLLVRTLEEERYPAVRYLLHRSMKSLHGSTASGYDYMASPSLRTEQLHALQISLRSLPRPDRVRFPYLPLTQEGFFSDDALTGLLRSRKDPDILVNE